MKALGITTFGPPSNIKILTLPDPKIEGEEDIIMKVYAMGVNRSDAFTHVIGAEFKGVIHEIGPNVTKFKPGDPVYGLSVFVRGSGSQFLHLTPYTRHYIALIPSYPPPSYSSSSPLSNNDNNNITENRNKILPFPEAAALSVCCSTTGAALWQAQSLIHSTGDPSGLRDKTVLVMGGLGGLGSSAIQLLKSVFRAGKVIITVSTPKFALVPELLRGRKD